MRTPIVIVGVLVCASCRIEPAVDQVSASTGVAPVEPEPEPEPEFQPTADGLPCAVELNSEEAKLLVAGRPTPIEFDPDQDTKLVTYPGGKAEVLVALGHESPWFPDRSTTSGESLWRVRCADPSKPERVVQREGTDFSWSAISPDGAHLYVTTNAGVHTYALATGKFEPLLPPRQIEDCWMHEKADVGSWDLVEGWALPGELLVLSGGPCGFEAEWKGELQVVTDFADPSKPAKRRAAAWVGALTAGAGNRIWVGDGDPCSLEYAPNAESGTPGVWRSEDAGASWTFLPLPKGVKAAVDQLWPSPSDPDRILAMTDCCVEYGGECSEVKGADSLFLTTNGGKTWKKILDGAEHQEFGIKDLIVDEANHEITVIGFSGAKVTRDDGKKWADSDAKLEKPTEARQRIEIGGFVIEATKDGVERRAPDAAPGTGEIVLRPGVNP